MVREIGPRAVTALRHARVGLWRFKRNPVQQDRAAMYATFAFIGLFTVGSVDAIVTGGADLAPHSAYAAEYRSTLITQPAPIPQPNAIELPTVEDALKAVEIDYSVTIEELLGGPEEQLAAVAIEPAPEGVSVEGKFEISKPNAGAPQEEPTL
jgi:hypothetical protein